MDVIEITVIFGFVMFSFIIGLHYGQKVATGDIKAPMETIKEIKQAKQENKDIKASNDAVKKDIERLEAIMRNIENYDGTARSQEEVPRGN